MSFCAPGPTTRAPGNIHVEMVDLRDLTDGFGCRTDDPAWDAVSFVARVTGTTPAKATFGA